MPRVKKPPALAGGNETLIALRAAAGPARRSLLR